MAASTRMALALSGGLIAETVNRIVPIIILHFVAVRIGVERFGYAQFGIQLMDFAIYFIMFGFHTIGAVQIGKVQNQPEKVGQIIAETTALKLFIASFTTVCLICGIKLSPQYTEFLPLVWALSFILFTTAIDLSYVHLGTQRMLAFSSMTVVSKIVSLAAIVLMVRGPEDTILYAVLAMGANGLVSTMSWIYNLRRFSYCWFTWPDLVRRFTDATPFAATALLLIALDRFDLFIVQHFGGTEEAGLYSPPSRLYFSVVNIVSALGGVFFSEMVSLSDRNKFTRIVQLSFKAMLIMIIPMAAGVWFVDEQLINLIAGPDYLAGAPVLSILLLGCVFHVAIVVFGMQVLQVKKQSRTLNWILLLTLLIAVGMSLLLYKHLGMLGVAWALVIAKALAAGILIWCMQSHLEQVPWREIFKVGIPALIMVCALMLLRSNNFILNLLVGGFVFSIAVLALNYQELKAIGKALRAPQPH